jgi:hypothetical protein
MNFKALEIGSGDAFLVEDEERTILFDSGGSTSRIKKLLKNKKKLDLAICSHNDSDHANGFIGLLDDSNFEIVEIWLPGLWVPILKFLIEKRLDREFFEVFYSYDARNEKEMKDQMIEVPMYKSLVEMSDSLIEDFDDDLQYISELIDNPSYLEIFNYTPWFNNSFIKLDRIVKIAGLAYRKGCLIRWFEPEEISPLINPPDYSFRAKNSKEIVRIHKVTSVTNFMKLLTLTNENKYSLVFELHKENSPFILFSADSDFSFLTKNIVYQNSIIITAPHHGSDSNANVYSMFDNDNTIWVRSDRKCLKRPCSQFKSLNDKYCVACKITNKLQTIEFELILNQWILRNGIECTC